MPPLLALGRILAARRFARPNQLIDFLLLFHTIDAASALFMKPKQEGPPIGGGSAKRDITHPTATVVYNSVAEKALICFVWIATASR